MQLIKFAAIFVVLISGAATVTQRLMHIRLDAPWYIEFACQIDNDYFEPLTLKATKSGSTDPIEFHSFISENQKIFRNTQPQNFRPNDVIDAELEYTVYEKSDGENKHSNKSKRRNNVKFEYTVKDKPSSDVLLIKIGASNITTDSRLPYVISNQIEQALSSTNRFHQETQSDISEQTDGIDESCPCTDPHPDPSYQQELLNTALSFTSLGTRLLFTGPPLEPTSTNAVDGIREIIVNKLKLPHLQYKILQAKFISQGLLFELAKPRDAAEVLTRARMLPQTPFKIETTKLDFIQVSDLKRIVK